MHLSNRLLSIIILFIIAIPAINLQAQKQKILPNPKNIIILIGDGMGYNHIAATNYYQGVKQQVYQQFPVQLAMAHYPAKAGEYDKNNPAKNYFAPGYNAALAWKDTAYLKRDYTESAAAATALATGVKTYNNAVGMSVDFEPLENVVQRAKSVGKSAGVVTSVEFSHATPAGFVAHNAARSNYSQLAYDMLLDSRCDVIMGCGDPMFDDEGLPVGRDFCFCARRLIAGSEMMAMITIDSQRVERYMELDLIREWYLQS